MTQVSANDAPTRVTVIDFLKQAVDRYASRDALLFKPAFDTCGGPIPGCGRSQGRSLPCSNSGG